MSIEFLCGEYSFNCNDKIFNRIKYFIIIATIDYIKIKISDDRKKFNDDLIGIGTSHYNHVKNINNLIATIETFINKCQNNCIENTQINELLNIFNNFCENNQTIQNAMIYFNIIGLYTLISKKYNLDSLYSSGNSYDIITLLDLIEPNILIVIKNKFNNDNNNNNNNNNKNKNFVSKYKNLTHLIDYHNEIKFNDNDIYDAIYNNDTNYSLYSIFHTSYKIKKNVIID